MRFLLTDQSLEGPSPCRRVLRPHLWAASSAGNVCSWSRAGPPRGDCHPLGLAASWETLIRAASLRGPVRVAQPGSHVTSRWLPGHLQDLPSKTLGLSWSQSSECLVPAAPSGVLKRAADLSL